MMRSIIAVGIVLGVGCVGVGGCGGDRKTPGELQVGGTPTGTVDGPVKVTLSFSRPMVGGERIGQPEPKPPLVIDPAIAGEARWVDDRTLVLQPSSSLPLSTRFVARVPGATRALDKSTLGIDHRFEFSTQRFSADGEVLGSDERATRDQSVKLTFNHDVAFDRVAKHCSYRSAKQRIGVKLAVDDGQSTKSYAVAPASELTADTDWALTCDAALHGDAGNLGLEQPLEIAFHTFGPLRFIGMKPAGNDIVPDENLALELELTNPLAAPYQIKIEPAVPGFPQRCFALGDERAGLRCAAQLEATTRYTVTIDATQRDMFGQTIDKPQVIAFATTDADPTISMETGYFVAELQRPVVPLWARNVSEMEARVVEISQANFHELRSRLDWWDNQPADFKKSKLAARDHRIAITGTKNQWGQHSIDPATLIGQKPGPGMYYLEIGSKQITDEPFDKGGRQKVLVNFTDIGVVSKLSPARGLVWATRLSTGKPLPGATVTVRDGNGKLTWTGTTDGDGVAVLPGMATGGGGGGEGDDEEDDFEEDEDGADEPAEPAGDPDRRVFVQHGADWTMVDPARSGSLSPWNFNIAAADGSAAAQLRGFMHTDRGLYRPGEKVHVKGIARVSRLGAPLDPPASGTKVRVTVEGPQGHTFAETEARTSAFGGFWFDLELPGDARLGDYSIRAELDHGVFRRDFTVEAYRPATFEVGGKTDHERVIRRGTVSATVSARYLYGAPLRAGDVELAVHARPRRVAFPQHAGFDFVDERRYDAYYSDEDEDSQMLVTEDRLALDSDGNAKFSFGVDPDSIPSDADLLIRAAVEAPSNEVIDKTFTVPYYRSRAYHGIKSPSSFLKVGKPHRFEIVRVTPDGRIGDGSAKVTVTRRDWSCVWEEFGYRGDYRCEEKTEKVLATTLTLAAGAPTALELTPPSGGEYWIVVETAGRDESAVAAQRLHAWGDGGGTWRSSDSLAMGVVADKREYSPGDTATLLLQTDLAEAVGLVTIERDGVIEKRVVDIAADRKHVEVPITAAHAPNVYVSVALVQRRIGDGPRGKPRMRMGVVNLPVRPVDNRLDVAIETDRADYRPGAEVTAKVKVTRDGKPVTAEVSITAADEGVLSLIGYRTPDPIPTFFAPWALGVTSATQVGFIRDIPGPNVDRPATGGDAAGTLRSRFISTAVWAPAAITDGSGVATVKFVAPDSLTAFRIMAVAADKTYRFGSSDKRFTVSKPLQLHQALPRFFNAGDRTTAGVVVHNETGAAGDAVVEIVADGAVAVAGDRQRKVALPVGARVPVMFDLTAAGEPGTATLRFTVAMNGERDAVEWKLPVRHPSPLRVHHVAHGVADAATTIPIALPPSAIAATAEVVVSVDPDGLAGIEDGLRELIGYPYGCLEQTTSAVIPMLAVRDLAESLAIDGLAPEVETGVKLERFVNAGVAKIGRHQTAGGGFSLWPGGDAEAYYTAYALWGLHLAKRSGFAVDKTRIADGLAYLKGDGKTPDTSRPYYDAAGDLGSQAFALYVRAALGDKDGQAATALIGRPDMPIYGKAFLARALAASAGARDPAVIELVEQLAAAAAVAEKGQLVDEPRGRELDGYMSSSLRTTAIVLDALVELDPKHASIEPLVGALMKARRSGGRFDTQENLYSLLALSAYSRSRSGSPAVTISIGDRKLPAKKLGGKHRLQTVTASAAGATAIAIAPRGGKVHYSVAIRHRREPSSLAAESNKIAIKREYFDEAGKPTASFRVGDIVRVKLTVEHADPAHHLMVSDPLPAGFEAINTRFATVAPRPGSGGDEWGTFRELHDDRVDLASVYQGSGDHVHEYSLRAIAAGTFARPPATAELMYDPDVRAQTALDTIEVKAK
jgi:uncharacterized protein YfaS (alpha-2-macroglobulin family)